MSSSGSSNLLHIESPEQFKEVLSKDLDKVSVLDFWAKWAQPCEKMNQVIKEASEKYKNVLFLMVSRWRDWSIITLVLRHCRPFL